MRSETFLSHRKSVAYDASYMPFLFDRDDAEEDAKPKGRRTFGKHGKEVDEAIAAVRQRLSLYFVATLIIEGIFRYVYCR